MFIEQCIEKYLNSIKLSRSANTYRTYANAMNLFREVLVKHNLEPNDSSVDQLSEDAVAWMASALKDFSSATEQVYITAVIGFYEFIAADDLAPVNLPRVRLIVKQRTRRPGVRLPQFPKSDIEMVLQYAETLASKPSEERMSA